MSTHYKDYYGTHMPFGQFQLFICLYGFIL